MPRKFFQLLLTLLLTLSLCLLPGKALAACGPSYPLNGPTLIRLWLSSPNCYFYLPSADDQQSCQPSCPAARPEAQQEAQPNRPGAALQEAQQEFKQEPKPETKPQQPAVNEDDTAAALTAEVIDLVNQERQAAGLEPLLEEPLLTQAATVRASEILISFSHTRPNGSSCFSALQEAGYRYQKAGENLALGQTNAAKAVADWMDSSGHRANILDPRFQYIGVAVQASPRGGYAWTQFFSD